MTSIMMLKLSFTFSQFLAGQLLTMFVSVGNLRGHFCGTLLQDTFAPYAAHSHTLWETLARHPCGTLLQDTLLLHSVGMGLLCNTFVGPSRRTLFGAFLQKTLVGQFCRLLGGTLCIPVSRMQSS